MIQILAPIIGAIVSIVSAGVLTSSLAQQLLTTLLRKDAAPPLSYADRLAKLTSSLNDSSKQVDAILKELTLVAKERENAVQALETNLGLLKSREENLKLKIKALEQVPIPAVDHFNMLLEIGERRKAHRDYLLFGLGAVVTTVITIALKFLGLA